MATNVVLASAAAAGGCNTLRSAANATWQPEIIRPFPGSRQLRVAVLVQISV